MINSLQHRVEKDLEQRSINGVVVYLAAWAFIALMSNFHKEQTAFFWIGIAWFCFLMTTRLICINLSGNLLHSSRRLWYIAFSFNALAPSLTFGCILAVQLLYDQSSLFFTYLFMAILAFSSGGAVSFSPCLPLVKAYLFVLLGPTIIIAVLIPDKFGNIGVLTAIYTTFMLLNIRRLNSEYHQLVSQQKALEDLSRLDGLTGIFNRRRFDEVMQSQWQSYEQHQAPIYLVLVDIDHFKRVNDTYGHPAGDEVIRQVTQIIAESCRQTQDFVARLGGEEFAVIISGDVDQQTVALLAERIRYKIENTPIKLGNNLTISITISLGIAYTTTSQADSHSSFYNCADKCLYQAKKSGRNQVVMNW